MRQPFVRDRALSTTAWLDISFAPALEIDPIPDPIFVWQNGECEEYELQGYLYSR